MANANRPSGLSPVKYLNGSPWSGQVTQYFIPSTNGSAFAIGDPVASGAASDANGVRGIVLATAGAGNPVLGAVVGMGGTIYGGPGADPNSLGTTIIPATKTRDYYVLVADDPNIIFEIQEVGTGTQLTSAEVGLNADLLSGTNNGFVSGWQVNNVGEGVGVTIQLRLLGLVQRRDNAFGAFAKWSVLINTHEFRIGTLGA